MRPGVVDVELQAMQTAVLELDHHGVIAGVDVAEIVGNGLEVACGSSEKRGVSVGGIRGYLQHGPVGNASEAVRIGYRDALRRGCGVEVYIQEVGEMAAETSQVAEAEDIALAKVLLQDQVKLLHLRSAQVGVEIVSAGLDRSRTA